jgi:segregation and condensation protein B
MHSPFEAKRILEAALLASPEPLDLPDLKKIFDGEVGVDTLRNLLAELKEEWSGRAVELVSVASGWRFQTRARYRATSAGSARRSRRGTRARSWRRWRSSPTGSR